MGKMTEAQLGYRDRPPDYCSMGRPKPVSFTNAQAVGP
jgi:hypothetical protein